MDKKKWSILDAKDGDILVTPTSQHTRNIRRFLIIFIFKGISAREYTDSDVVDYYLYMYKGLLYIQRGTSFMGLVEDQDGTRPATEDEKGYLFRMLDLYGYRWDEERKQLVKLQEL